MNTSQLLCVLNCNTFLKYIERNVLAADQLPKASLQHFPSAFIVNTDISSMEGKHWVAFYFDEYKNGEFFDSYGKPPQSYKQAFLNFLTKNAHKYQFNDKKLQNDRSTVCGEYLVLYLLCKARGYTMREIVDRLSFNHSDQYVYDLIKNIFYMCFSSPQTICTNNQNCKPLIKKYWTLKLSY